MSGMNRRTWGLFVGLALALLAQQSQAAGFYISEVGTPGSLGTAGVANPVNTIGADASWTNPAGMTGIAQDHFLVGGQVLIPKIEFDSSRADAGGNDGHNAGNVAFIPSFFIVKEINDRTRFGFSVTAPQGGGVNYGDDFVGRYGASKVGLSGVGISPSIGYEVTDKLSVGAGLSFIYTQFEQSIALNQVLLGAAPGTPDAKVKMDNLDDWGYQPFLGLTYEFSDRMLLGVVYRAEADVNLKGDLNFRNLTAIPTPPANNIDISWDNPQWLEAGLRYKLGQNMLMAINLGWQDWSVFSENQLAITGGPLSPVAVLDRNWKDTWHAGIAFGNLEGGRGYTFGASYDSSPVDDKDRTIDLPMDETWKLSAAYGWEIGKELHAALGGTLAIIGDAEVEQQAQGVTFAGDFDTNYVLFLGATVRYQF